MKAKIEYTEESERFPGSIRIMLELMDQNNLEGRSEMGLFDKKPMGYGVMDVIRCDEPSYLIWKWHPEGTTTYQNRKENAIRWGSSLRVKEGSVAVFVYKLRNGIIQDYIEGPFDQILDTNNLPVISSIIGLAYDGGTPFQAEVYFINLAQIIQLKFAVPYFDVYDPRFLDYGVPTAVRGTISFKITDYKGFIKLHRLDNFSIDDFQEQIKDAVIRYIKSVVSNAPEENSIPVIQLERRIAQINDLVETSIKGRFFDDFGVTVSGVDIAVIDLDKTSEGYNQLKAVTQDLTTATMQAQTMNNMVVGLNQQQVQKPVTPPPAHIVTYNVAVNGQATGPFDLATLGRMVAAGQLLKDSLVWRNGMSSWLKAGDVDELKSLFPEMPPIPTSTDGMI